MDFGVFYDIFCDCVLVVVGGFVVICMLDDGLIVIVVVILIGFFDCVIVGCDNRCVFWCGLVYVGMYMYVIEDWVVVYVEVGFENVVWNWVVQQELMDIFFVWIVIIDIVVCRVLEVVKLCFVVVEFGIEEQ